jgi:hypothetical protein
MMAKGEHYREPIALARGGDHVGYPPVRVGEDEQHVIPVDLAIGTTH